MSYENYKKKYNILKTRFGSLQALFFHYTLDASIIDVITKLYYNV